MFEPGIYLLMSVLALSFGMALVRLLIGTRFIDRLIALDVLMVHAVGLVALYAMVRQRPLLLDIIIVMAIAGFLTTVALAHYIEQRRGDV